MVRVPLLRAVGRKTLPSRATSDTGSVRLVGESGSWKNSWCVCVLSSSLIWFVSIGSQAIRSTRRSNSQAFVRLNHGD